METHAYIAVVGSSDSTQDILDKAEAVGATIGKRGARLVCGGLGGVMEAACRGAKAAGGLTIGVLPGLDHAAANPHVDVTIPTGMGEMRNALIVRSAHAVIGLDTWELARRGERVNAIRRAGDAETAVTMALEAAGF